MTDPPVTGPPVTGPATTVSTHVLDTAVGRPAAGVPVTLAARVGADAPWKELGGAATGPDGRCTGLPALPAGTTHARLAFDTASRAPGGAFFPEVAVAFAVTPGEHFHVPLLLSPFGYSVYRGS